VDYDPDDDAYVGFFHETGTGQHVPRCVMVDTEPTVLNDIKVSSMRNLFHPDNMIAFKRDCRANFFEGKTMADAWKVADVVMDRMRHAIDLCDNPQGFFVFHAFGGGTGSGTGVKLLEEMRDCFGFKKCIFQPVIYPSKHYSSSIVEPYNCLLATHHCQDKDLVDMSIMMDNEAVYKMCNKQLQLQSPHFHHVNCLIAQCISGLTGPLRYETELNATLNEIQNNLVPTPTFKHPLLSISPVRHEERRDHEKFRTADIIGELFDSRNFLCDISALNSNRYLAAVVMMRGDRSGEDGDDATATSASMSSPPGKDGFRPICANQVISALNALRKPPDRGYTSRKIRFLPWMEGSGMKIGIVKARPAVTHGFCMTTPKRQGVLLANTTAVRQLFNRQYCRFLKLWVHNAYLWQFISAGGEAGEIDEAREGVRKLIDDYEELIRQSADQEADSGMRIKCSLDNPPAWKQ